jgi:hypothetical protein
MKNMEKLQPALMTQNREASFQCPAEPRKTISVGLFSDLDFSAC